MADQAVRLQTPLHLKSHSCPHGLNFIVVFPLTEITTQIPIRNRIIRPEKPSREFTFCEQIVQGRQKRKRITTLSFRCHQQQFLELCVLYILMNLFLHTMVPIELAFHFIDRTWNKNSLLTSLFRTPIVFFISSFDSSCNSDYKPDVSSWATKESYLLKVLNKWLNSIHDYRVESIYLQSSSFSHIPVFPAEPFNLQMKAWKDSITYEVLN